MKYINRWYNFFCLLKPLTYVLLLLFFLALSCNKIDTKSPQKYTGVISVIPMGLRSGTINAEDVIYSARVVVFTSSGEFVSNKTFSLTPDIDNKYEVSAHVAKGLNNIYIICNETPSMSSILSNVSAISDLENMTYTDLTTAPPLTMFAMAKNIDVTVDNTGKASALINGVSKNVIDVTVKRTMAKLSMTVIKNVGLDQKFSVEELSYKVCRAPKYSNLMEGVLYPQGAGWRPEVNVIGSGKLSLTGDGSYDTSGGGYAVPSGVDQIVMPDIYIPEHLPIVKEHPDYCTYLLIEAKCMLEGSSMMINAKYKLDIGNNPPLDKTLERSGHYKIYATIRNLGAMGFYAEIIPVNQFDIPVNWKPFEGYVIVSEKVAEHGKNINIWNNYSEYSGILKITKNKAYYNALFRYGSTVALTDGSAESDFTTTDVIWKPAVSKTIASWGDVGYQQTGDVTEVEHTLDNIKQGKGDPCRLVGLTEDEISSGTIDNRLWRMPTQIEMAWLNTARNDEANVNGFYSFSYLLTPNTGYRNNAGRMMLQVGKGSYWSSSNKSSFIFDSATNTSAAAADDPQNAYAVRCIRTTTPSSRFVLKNVGTVGYTGTGAFLNFIGVEDSFITPYWKMSASPTDGFTFEKDKGGNSDNVRFNITPLADPYKGRDFVITGTAYGLDGVVHTVTSVVSQRSLIHEVLITYEGPNLVEKNGYLRIPKEGATLKFGAVISPTPYSPYDVDFNQELWRIICKFYDDKEHDLVGSSVMYEGISEVIIPANTYGHARALEVDFSPLNRDEYPPYGVIRSEISNKLVFIQEAE